MVLYTNKKLVLLSCLVSGIIIAAERLGQHNCNVVIARDEVGLGIYGRINTLMFFHKNDPTKTLFTSDYFDRTIKSISWDIEKPGFLNINFEDGNKIGINVNKPLSNAISK